MNAWCKMACRMIRNGGFLTVATASPLLLGCSECCAASPENISGSIRSWTKAPRGEIDGAVLDNGTILHWPPHLEKDFQNSFNLGDPVDAIGQTETTPHGDTHFEVTRLTNTKTKEEVHDDRRRPVGPPPHRDDRSINGEYEKIDGVIDEFMTAPRGEIDGATLVDGTVLHWPPHLGDRFREAIDEGDHVEVRGHRETKKHGEVRFEVDELKNVETGEVIRNDGPKPPAPPRKRGIRRETFASTRTLGGIVREMTTAPKGETDGAILEGGTVLHWPPHQGDRFADIVKVGRKIEVEGQYVTTKRGDEHFEVERIHEKESDAPKKSAPRTDSEKEGGTDLADRLSRLEQQLLQIQRAINDIRRSE